MVRKRVTTAVLSGESLQACRAVEVLERAGTSEARQVLAVLGSGATGAPLTVQAREALVRLQRK